jgi:preprotein translocase subunit SecF
MFIGIVTGTFSSIFIATPVMLLWHREKKPQQKMIPTTIAAKAKA